MILDLFASITQDKQSAQSGTQQQPHRGFRHRRSGRSIDPNRKRIKVLDRMTPGYRVESAGKLYDTVALVATHSIAVYDYRRATELTIRAAGLKCRCCVEGK